MRTEHGRRKYPHRTQNRRKENILEGQLCCGDSWWWNWLRTLCKGKLDDTTYPGPTSIFYFGDRHYKEPSVTSGTGATIWSKANSEPTFHHHPRSSPLPRICTVPSASAIFKCILEVVFSDMKSGKQRKLRWVGDDSHVVFVRNS
jgi:hypothetical protein